MIKNLKFLPRLTLTLTWINFLVLVSIASAQHDAHRNAVRHIAAGKFAKAEKELKSADADDTETRFVRVLMALEQDDLATATKHAKAAIDGGLPIERFVAGPRPTMTKLTNSPTFQSWLEKGEATNLVHGPMIGNVTDSSASIWVRTAKPADCSVRLRPHKSASDWRTSRSTESSEASDHIAVIDVSELEPNRRYDYEVMIDGTALGSGVLTTFPQRERPAQFTVCFGGGAGFVPKWERMWDTILAEEPTAMFMLGDNVYIDDPEQPLTNHYCYYRRQSRPEWRRFISRTAMFSIYDDHDFGTNDCVPGAAIDTPAWKRTVWQTFRQNWVNPGYGGGDEQPGCWYDFMIGDVHFIMLDGRYYRTRKPQPSMLGPVQKKWLKETLTSSNGKFKVIASPVPFTANIKPGSKDPWDGYADEREEIFSFVETQKINGAFLIAADRHRTDLRVTKRDNGYDLYEFESSKLTNRHTHSVIKTPGLIWGHNKTCSFALMRFDTTAKDPHVIMEAHNIDGDLLHSHKLPTSALQHQ